MLARDFCKAAPNSSSRRLFCCFIFTLSSPKAYKNGLRFFCFQMLFGSIFLFFVFASSRRLCIPKAKPLYSENMNSNILLLIPYLIYFRSQNTQQSISIILCFFLHRRRLLFLKAKPLSSRNHYRNYFNFISPRDSLISK